MEMPSTSCLRFTYGYVLWTTPFMILTIGLQSPIEPPEILIKLFGVGHVLSICEGSPPNTLRLCYIRGNKLSDLLECSSQRCGRLDSFYRSLLCTVEFFSSPNIHVGVFACFPYTRASVFVFNVLNLIYIPHTECSHISIWGYLDLLIIGICREVDRFIHRHLPSQKNQVYTH